MPRKIDISGVRFGYLVASEAKPPINNVTMWECRCDCGMVVTVATNSLRQGNTKSCGCRKSAMVSERMKVAMRTHGGTGTSMYRIWSTMWQRCTNPRNGKYPLYGARGITVCKAWEDFAVFKADMGPRPDDSYTLDRIDPNGNYEPGNVRWATQIEQQNNRRDNRRVVYGGESLTIAEIGRRTGVSPNLIRQRIDRDGFSVERAVRSGKTRFEVYDVVV